MDMVHPKANLTTPIPLLDRLKAAPSRLKPFLKDTAVECVKNVFALVVTQFPRLPLDHAATGVAADFNVDLLSDLADQYQDVAESIVNNLDR